MKEITDYLKAYKDELIDVPGIGKKSFGWCVYHLRRWSRELYISCNALHTGNLKSLSPSCGPWGSAALIFHLYDACVNFISSKQR